MSLHDQIMNGVLVSILEELFIMIIILKLINQNKYLSKEYLRKNILKIFLIAVIPIVFMSNFMFYLTTITGNGIFEGVNTLLMLIMFIISTFLIVKIENKKQIRRVLFSAIGGFIIFIAIELFCIAVMTYVLNINVASINKTPYMNLLISIPERIIEYGFLFYKFSRVNSLKTDLKDKDILKLMLENQNTKIVLCLVMIVDFLVMYSLGKIFYIDKLLTQVTKEGQIFILILITSLLILLNLVLWLQAINIYSREKYIQHTIKEGYDE